MILFFLALLQITPKVVETEPPQNFGIGPRQEFAKDEKTTLDGKEVSRERVMQLLQAGAPELPDDKNKPWLVYVGRTKDEASKTRALLSPLATKYRIQSASEGEWYTKKRDGSIRFKPGATVLLADGTEVYQTEDVAGLLDKLRGLADDFDLRKLPDLFRIPTPPLLPNVPNVLGQVPWWAWALGAGVLFLMLTRKKS